MPQCSPLRPSCSSSQQPHRSLHRAPSYCCHTCVLQQAAPRRGARHRRVHTSWAHQSGRQRLLRPELDQGRHRCQVVALSLGRYCICNCSFEFEAAQTTSKAHKLSSLMLCCGWQHSMCWLAEWHSTLPSYLSCTSFCWLSEGGTCLCLPEEVLPPLPEHPSERAPVVLQLCSLRHLPEHLFRTGGPCMSGCSRPAADRA